MQVIDVELPVGKRHRLRGSRDQPRPRPRLQLAPGNAEVMRGQVEPGDVKARVIRFDLAQKAAGAATDVEQRAPRSGPTRADLSGTSAWRRMAAAPPPNSTST